MSGPLDFTGRTVLVVGGSSGIGNASAQAFRTAGADVHVWGTRATAAHYDGVEGSDLSGLTYSRVDVGDPGAVDAWHAPFETLDVLMLSQGMVLYKRQEYALAGFVQVLNVNLTSVMQCAMKFHAMLASARGAMLVVSSTAAFQATKGNPAYAASKHGVMGLTRTLGQAWAASGVRVNGIAPGFVYTKLTTVTTGDPDRRGAVEASIPLGRIGDSQEIANIALFLASPLASYIVGHTIIADGGMLL